MDPFDHGQPPPWTQHISGSEIIHKIHKNGILMIEGACKGWYNALCNGGSSMPAKLSGQAIYDTQFSVKGRGYDAEEVDTLLDQVIEDYQEFEEESLKLSSALLTSNEQIQSLKKENEELKAKIAELEEQLAAAAQKAEEENEEPAEPLSLEERVARLEKAVFSV